jgi:hypothetical protein
MTTRPCSWRPHALTRGLRPAAASVPSHCAAHVGGDLYVPPARVEVNRLDCPRLLNLHPQLRHQPIHPPPPTCDATARTPLANAFMSFPASSRFCSSPPTRAETSSSVAAVSAARRRASTERWMELNCAVTPLQSAPNLHLVQHPLLVQLLALEVPLPQLV